MHTGATMKKIFLLILLLTQIVFSNSINKGWELFINNKPQEAKKVFTKITEKEKKGDKAAAAFRGLSAVESFLGDIELAALYCVDSWDANHNSHEVGGCMQPVMSLMRLSYPSVKDEVLRLSKEMMQKNPEDYVSVALYLRSVDYLLSVGESDSAAVIPVKLGILNKWKFIGPFNNYSNGGMFRSFAPENGFDINTKMKGTSGYDVKWHDLPEKNPQGWYDLVNHQDIKNAINYFATTVQSPKKQEVTIAVGLSGVFNIWLNGEKIMFNEIYQNTDIDQYMVKVKLKKGENHILLKLGHEENVSNFVVRIKDKKGRPLQLKHGFKAQPAVKNNTPKLELIENDVIEYARKKIKKDKDNLEWPFILIEGLSYKEDLANSKKIILSMLEKYPNSAYFIGQLSLIYAREKNKTLYELYADKALKASPEYYNFWLTKFVKLCEGNDTQAADNFYKNKSPLFSNNAKALVQYALLQAKLGRENEFYTLIDSIGTMHKGQVYIIDFLVSIYEKMGLTTRTDLLMKAVFKNHKYSKNHALLIYNWLQKRGQDKEAISFLTTVLKRNPNSTKYYGILFDYYYQKKNYDKALKALEGIERYNPFLSTTHARISKAKLALKDTVGAKNELEEVLKLHYTNYTAANRLREIDGKPRWSEMTTNYNLDDLKKQAKQWKEGRTRNSLYLLNQNSIIVYPKQGFEVIEKKFVEILDAKGIDDWKENSFYSTSQYENVSVIIARVIKKDGKKIDADRGRGQFVFTNLEIGDIIEIEISRKSFYDGLLARNLENFFYMANYVPSLITTFEIYAPNNMKYNVLQNGIKIQADKKSNSGYTRTTFTNRKAITEHPEDNMPSYDLSYPWIYVSTFKDWKYISDWYQSLTVGKAIQTSEIKDLADSLFKDLDNDYEKVRKVHSYITDVIRYSHLSFRQAGYVPQQAATTLSTQVGDCKDMAVLAKTLLAASGVESNLVLVNTRNEASIKTLPSLLFNHCILEVNGLFVDFTAPNNDLKSLPVMDQGALALEASGTNSGNLIYLPVLDSSVNYNRRISNDTLLNNGLLIRNVNVYKTGDFTPSYRKFFRYSTNEEIHTEFEKIIRTSFAKAELKNYEWSGSLNTDTIINYKYKHLAPEAAYTSNKLMIFKIPWASSISAKNIPGETTRNYYYQPWQNNLLRGNKSEKINMALPQEYNVLDLPSNQKFSCRFGKYEVKYEIKDHTLHTSRTFYLSSKNISPQEYPELREFLEKIVDSDQGMLVLIRKNAI